MEVGTIVVRVNDYNHTQVGDHYRRRGFIFATINSNPTSTMASYMHGSYIVQEDFRLATEIEQHAYLKLGIDNIAQISSKHWKDSFPGEAFNFLIGDLCVRTKITSTKNAHTADIGYMFKSLAKGELAYYDRNSRLSSENCRLARPSERAAFKQGITNINLINTSQDGKKQDISTTDTSNSRGTALTGTTVSNRRQQITVGSRFTGNKTYNHQARARISKHEISGNIVRSRDTR